ncbi:MAG: hypothetical protein OXG04_03230 [Acidobacteria bacterium]|nr:hypothetical protein [Acidobacteriota bacterium]
MLTVVVCVVLLAFFAREYGRPPSPPSPTVQDVLVTHIWIGLLDADREAEVFDALFG